MASMDGTVALVTGAASGLGKAVATGLAREGALVVVVGRSTARAEEAMNDIRRLVPAALLEPLACDLSVQSSIRTAAAEFLSRHDRLDVLVNAAGVFRKERHVTPDGLELTFATNVMAYFLLTNAPAGCAQESRRDRREPRNCRPAGRGGAHIPHREYRVQIRQHQTQLRRPPDCEGQVQLPSFDAAHDARPGSPHPGVRRASSRLWRGGERRPPGAGQEHVVAARRGGPFRWITNAFGAPAEKAVDTALWLATSRETAAVSGKLWAKREELPTPGMGSDSEVRKRLWDACSHLAGLP